MFIHSHAVATVFVPVNLLVQPLVTENIVAAKQFRRGRQEQALKTVHLFAVDDVLSLSVNDGPLQFIRQQMVDAVKPFFDLTIGHVVTEAIHRIKADCIIVDVSDSALDVTTIQQVKSQLIANVGICCDFFQSSTDVNIGTDVFTQSCKAHL